MAGTAVEVRQTGLPGSDVKQLCITGNALVDDAETLRAAVAAVNTLTNQLRVQSLYRALGNPGFAINSNFDVKNANAISYLNGGTLKSLSANTNFDTGTAATIATTKWGAALLSVDASGTAVVTWFTAAGVGYASEALAIAALTAAAATDTVLGYITVQAAGTTWTAATDALTTGTGGTPATATNYYNSVNPNSLYVGAALTTTTVDAAGDMTAAKLNFNGSAITA